jgi:hypothetical protein
MSDSRTFKSASKACKDAYIERCWRLQIDLTNPENFNRIDLEFCIFKDGWNAAKKERSNHE